MLERRALRLWVFKMALVALIGLDANCTSDESPTSVDKLDLNQVAGADLATANHVPPEATAEGEMARRGFGPESYIVSSSDLIFS